VAATHFLVLPTTIEVFSWRVVDTATNQIISWHRNLRVALDKAERLNAEAGATALPREVGKKARRCGYEDGRYRCPCGSPATVTDIETGCTFCATHFWEVIL
jgi:hypothetical protein